MTQQIQIIARMGNIEEGLQLYVGYLSKRIIKTVQPMIFKSVSLLFVTRNWVWET